MLHSSSIITIIYNRICKWWHWIISCQLVLCILTHQHDDDLKWISRSYLESNKISLRSRVCYFLLSFLVSFLNKPLDLFNSFTHLFPSTVEPVTRKPTILFTPFGRWSLVDPFFLPTPRQDRLVYQEINTVRLHLFSAAPYTLACCLSIH